METFWPVLAILGVIATVCGWGWSHASLEVSAAQDGLAKANTNLLDTQANLARAKRDYAQAKGDIARLVEASDIDGIVRLGELTDAYRINASHDTSTSIAWNKRVHRIQITVAPLAFNWTQDFEPLETMTDHTRSRVADKLARALNDGLVERCRQQLEEAFKKEPA